MYVRIGIREREVQMKNIKLWQHKGLMDYMNRTIRKKTIRQRYPSLKLFHSLHAGDATILYFDDG